MNNDLNKMIHVDRKELIELILDITIKDYELEDLHRNWLAFYRNPLKYKNFGMMIAEYLELKR